MYLVATFAALAGVCNAVMDTLVHHWYGSIFQKFAKNNAFSWWGRGDLIWLRKYEWHQSIDGCNWEVGPKKKVFTRFYAGIVEAFNDAWHFAKSCMWACIGTAIVLAWATEQEWSLVWTIILVILPSLSFTVTYWLLTPSKDE